MRRQQDVRDNPHLCRPFAGSLYSTAACIRVGLQAIIAFSITCFIYLKKQDRINQIGQR